MVTVSVTALVQVSGMIPTDLVPALAPVPEPVTVSAMALVTVADLGLIEVKVRAKAAGEMRSENEKQKNKMAYKMDIHYFLGWIYYPNCLHIV